MSDKTPRFQSAADLFASWRDGVLSGEPPTLYPVGDGELGRVEIGPGLVTIMGGAPGAGKTALVMQWVFEALARTSDLRALVCNVEMPPTVLLDRQLARLSGIDARTIRHRRLDDEHADPLRAGMGEIEAIGDRLAFVRPPYSLDNIIKSAIKFEADLLVVDYIQRIAGKGGDVDRRGSIDDAMSKIRIFADAGAAVIVVAALNRGHEGKGYNPDSLTLASFRESSELEYGADDAYIVAPAAPAPGAESLVVVKHLKSRHGECRDLRLRFDKARQKFDDADAGWLDVEPPSDSEPEPADNGEVNLYDIWRRA